MQILKQEGDSDKLEQFVYKTEKDVSKPQPRNERDLVVTEFYERLVAEWRPFYVAGGIKKKGRPWTIARVAQLLAPIKNLQDIYLLLSECKQANSFTALFKHKIGLTKKPISRQYK